MPGQGGWKTVLKYVAGIVALSVSVAAAWFLPGLYAGWQDQQMEGRVVLSKRESIQFLDTDSLDIARRLQILEDTETFDWTWSHGSAYSETEQSIDKVIERCRRVLGDWCEAGMFPADCLDVITWDHMLIFETGLVYSDGMSLPIYCFHFHGEDGYGVTVLVDASLDMIYYASVSGWAMLDVISAELGFESFEEMAKYELKLLEALGLDVVQFLESGGDDEIYYFLEECERRAGPAEESSCDFAAVCGAQGEKVSRDGETMGLDAVLSFVSFTSHAYRRIAAVDYATGDGLNSGAGLAVMYGTMAWEDLIRDFSAIYGNAEELINYVEDWYAVGLEYAVGDPEILEFMRGYPGADAKAKTQAEASQKLPASEPYDAMKDPASSQAAEEADDSGQGEVYDSGNVVVAPDGW